MKTPVRELDDAVINAYLRDLRRYPPLTREAEGEAVREALKGNRKAYERLVSSNLRFVVSVALQYRGRGLPLSELIAVGNVGLLKAVERFDLARGYKLISYAVWWIRQSIRKALDGERLVSVPGNRVDDMAMISRRWNQICQRSGQNPTMAEVTEDMEISALRAERALLSLAPPFRLDAPSAPPDGKKRTLPGTLEASCPEPDARILEEDRRKLIEDAIASCLSNREEEVIRACYGLDQDLPQTLKQVGDELGISRERVRQIRNRALVKVRRYFALHLPDVTIEDVF